MPQATLTLETVKAAACPEGKTKITFFDTELSGFMLEVRASGKTFYARYRNQRGKQVQYRIGPFPKVQPRNARKKAHDVLERVALGEDPRETDKARKQTPTLHQFVDDQYLPYVASYKNSTDTDVTLLRCHILPAFGAHHLDQITKYELVQFTNRKYTDGLAPATVNRLLILLRYMFNLAIDWEVPGVTTNPARGVGKFKENNKHERFLTPEEVQRLMEAVRTSRNPDLEHIIRMLLLTGARKQEVLQARWQDIDLERKRWHIPETKAGRARNVPLSDTLVNMLSELPSRGDSPYVFPCPKTGEPYKAIYNVWNRVRKKAGLPDVRLHDLRHSFASFLINSGHSLYEVQKLLGHHSISVTERYAHLADETLKNACESAATQAIAAHAREEPVAQAKEPP